VATASTKSRRKDRSIAAEEPAPEILTKRNWKIASAAVLITGAILRLSYLTLVPLHHDEGVNGNFLISLVRNGTYQYDPQNYHGPTLYYFAAIIPWICRFLGGKGFGDAYGLTTFNIRLVTAAFGVGTIGLVLLLRNRLGTIGALSAAALIAISPGAVYLSRYFIHESLFVFFTLGIVVAALKYYDTAKPVHLILAAASASLMVATKETWIINGPVLLIALVTTGVYCWLRDQISGRAPARPARTPFLARFGGPVPLITIALVALAIFIMIDVLFYSSFFKNYPKGVHDSLETLKLWRQRTHEHEKPWPAYLEWLRAEEILILLSGAAGAIVSIWRAHNRFAVFIAQYSFGLLAAYSLVGYKTPWITLNFIVPLAITGGYAFDVAYEKLREFEQPRFFVGVALIIVAICGYQMITLNFYHYDDDKYAYVYAHTNRQTNALADQVDRIAKRAGSGHDTGIAIIAPDYWPLPWYFRDYKRALFYGRLTASTEQIIVAERVPTNQEADIKTTGADGYELVMNPGSDDGSFTLRPGVDLLLYVRRDVLR